jgi:SAM-dependent methyltransferase
MDLDKFGVSQEQVECARDLACRGLLCYQPFAIEGKLYTGVGHEIFTQGGHGLVHTTIVPEKYIGSKHLERFLVNPAHSEKFIADNVLLDELYQKMLGFIDERLGGVQGVEFADVGCCSGYFSMNLAARGAKKVIGYDRIDYSETFALLNEIMGTDAQFRHQAYKRGTIKDAEETDVVVSVAVLVHISDVLHHLAFLGRLARKAIFVWTNTMADPAGADEELLIRFQDHNNYYESDEFPYCFDLMFISPKLLRLSLSLMGFTEIHEFTDFPPNFPEKIKHQHRGYLALRP